MIRLPPFHCHLKPIELIWAQIQYYVAKEIKGFIMTETEKRTSEAIDRVTGQKWKKCVQNVEKEMWETKERKRGY